MAKINSDPLVMEFFSAVQDFEQTESFIERMQQQYAEKGFCYFAVDKLSNNKLIGFIGISEQTYEADFTPCIDIGWRLAREEWEKGLATEGAKACLKFAFEKLNLVSIKAICPIVNLNSERVMKKIGMTRKKIFLHPLLKANKKLQKCVLYEISKNRYMKSAASGEQHF